MNTRKLAVLGISVAIVLMLSLLLLCFVIFPANLVRAEEVESNTAYDQAHNQAEKIVEQLELKEYLSKYFEENMADLIVTIVIAVVTAMILLSSVFITVKTLRDTIKKYGVESDATKEVIGQLTSQLKDTQKAMEEIESTKKEIEANNAQLQEGMKKLSEDNALITKVLQIAFTNNPSLIERGYASQINDIIEEQ